MRLPLLVPFLLLVATAAGAQHPSPRRVMSLNGAWEIAEGDTGRMPARFEHSVPVPGLVSLASPPFRDAGPRVKDRTSIAQFDTLRQAFWYRRRFTVKGPLPQVTTLKIAKAMFGTHAYLNGKFLGEHLPCFTPGFFDATQALKQGGNEIIIRVGSCRGALPQSIPTGFDFEKERYIPGIYDNVDLILSGTPRILRVQTIPDIAHDRVRDQLAFRSDGTASQRSVVITVREAKSSRVAASTFVSIPCDVPRAVGTYTVQATLETVGGHPVRSIREIPVR